MRKEIGAIPDLQGTRFCVWAPQAQRVEVLKWNAGTRFSLEKKNHGYFEGITADFRVGDLYKFRVDEKTERPDPASRFQPEGPHGPSQIVTPEYLWTDAKWQGLPLKELVIYELHVGCFSKEGSFKAIEDRLEHFKKLGVNAIEIMPIGQFPGTRNWGYDGVNLFAPQNSYGKTKTSFLELKDLINACHREKIAVILDVVYNHLGPEGNYLREWGPYFQERYHNAWGAGLNFDGPDCDEVRNYFLENARYWLEEFHLDGLRLDAVHAIIDSSAKTFLEELAQLKSEIEKKTGRQIHLIAETENNDPRLLKPLIENGVGLDAQWADDLHHVLHVLLTGENQSYYADFGNLQQLGTVFQRGLVFEGQYSKAKRRHHGKSYFGIPRTRLVVCSQNHDQVGNRCCGERLISLVGPHKQRLAAACVFLSGALPLIFMGEELGLENPFLYFVDPGDQQILKAVQEGRRKEFSAFSWKEEVPDPGSLQTFEKSVIDWQKAEESPQSTEFILYYKRLIELSKWIRQQDFYENEIGIQIKEETKTLQVQLQGSDQGVPKEILICVSFSEVPQTIAQLAEKGFEFLLDSADPRGEVKRSLPNNIIAPFSVLLAQRRQDQGAE